ncbi:MAG: hypothetical protein Kow00127_13600 [Bacteroidales bacterium]
MVVLDGIEMTGTPGNFIYTKIGADPEIPLVVAADAKNPVIAQAQLITAPPDRPEIILYRVIQEQSVVVRTCPNAPCRS